MPAWNAPPARRITCAMPREELKTLAPKDGEETALAGRRTTMMQGEKIATDLREAQDAISRHAFAGTGAVGRGAPAGTPRRQFAGAGRARGEGDRRRDQRAGGGRPAPQRRAGSRPTSIRPSSSGSRSGCSRLRAASRKYSTPVDGLAALAAKYAADVALIDAGADQLKKLEAAAGEADKRYGAAAAKLSAARTKSAEKLNKAVNAELAPLEARARQIHDPGRHRCGLAGAAGHRPRRILGADQSRHESRAR